MNQEQFEILRDNVDRWNTWRQENPGVEIDLAGADLRDCLLRGANLSFFCDRLQKLK